MSGRRKSRGRWADNRRLCDLEPEDQVHLNEVKNACRWAPRCSLYQRHPKDCRLAEHIVQSYVYGINAGDQADETPAAEASDGEVQLGLFGIPEK